MPAEPLASWQAAREEPEVEAEEGAEEAEHGEVITETIAELYARQGVYDRAAEVYRELARRGDASPELLRRLEEVERLAAGEEEPLPEPVAVQELVAERETAREKAPVPPTITGYLAELLAWSPAARQPEAPEWTGDAERSAAPEEAGVRESTVWTEVAAESTEPRYPPDRSVLAEERADRVQAEPGGVEEAPEAEEVEPPAPAAEPEEKPIPVWMRGRIR